MKTILSLLVAGFLLTILGLDGIRSGMRSYGSSDTLYFAVPLLFVGFVLTWVSIIAAGVSLGNSQK